MDFVYISSFPAISSCDRTERPLISCDEHSDIVGNVTFDSSMRKIRIHIYMQVHDHHDQLQAYIG